MNGGHRVSSPNATVVVVAVALHTMTRMIFDHFGPRSVDVMAALETPAAMLHRYDPKILHDGWNILADGERIYYISNPALGLWAHRRRLA